MTGEMLKRILDIKGVSVNALAKKINVSPQTLYSIIKRNSTKFDVDLLTKIYEALNIDNNFIKLINQSFYKDVGIGGKGSSFHYYYFYHDEDDIDDIILYKYNDLNETGKQKVNEYINDLLENPKYTANDENK